VIRLPIAVAARFKPEQASLRTLGDLRVMLAQTSYGCEIREHV
jgi:hypothetical protein